MINVNRTTGRTTGKILAFCLLLFLSAATVSDTQKIRPSKALDAAFLLSTWKPNAPDLIVFKDPFCSYCIDHLIKRALLENYNVYIYWAPILSEKSRVRVKAFFKCDGPVAESVLESVITFDAPNCRGEFKRELYARNNEVVHSYSPNTVPQYWLNGSLVHYSQLNLPKKMVAEKRIDKASELKINWRRYRPMSVNEPKENKFNMAVVLPEEFTQKSQLIRQLKKEKRYNWYVFSNNIDTDLLKVFWCDKKNESACARNMSESKIAMLIREFKLLTGLEKRELPVILLSGRRLTEKEMAYIIPKEIRILPLTLSHSRK